MPSSVLQRSIRSTTSGATARVSGRLFEAGAHGHAWPASLGGRVHCVRRGRIEVPGDEVGYHRLRWQIGGLAGESTVIVAPLVAWGAPGTVPPRWGVFAPLYAARQAERGAVGDLEILTSLLAWVRGQGGHYVATLPLLAGFLDEPCHPSPYSPASRLFWNELYLAPGGGATGDAATDLAERAAARARFATDGPIDYRAEYRARRARLDREARAAWADPARKAELVAAAESGSLLDYAVFRAIGERQVVEARPEELDELVHHALLAQHLGDRQHEVGRGHAFLQRAGDLEADHFREQHRLGLAEHGGLGLDAADAPAEHG